VAAVVVAPLSLAWSIARTSVRDVIGVSPTTFTIGTSGHSELRLGIAGTVYVPRSAGPFGLVATVDGPAEVQPGTADQERDLATLVSPKMLQLYTGLFHDPERAVRGYVDLVVDEAVRTFLLTELVLSVTGAGVVLALRRLLPRRPDTERLRGRVAATAVLLALVSSGLAVGALEASDADEPERGVYALPALDGTQAAGATTSSVVLRLLLGDAVPKVQELVARQEANVDAFTARAESGLRTQASAMTGPRDGELAVLMESDMHCNQAMIGLQSRVRAMLTDAFGKDVPALMAITGDLTTNGTAAENGCIDDERAVAGDAPVVAVTGNHESTQSAAAMAAAGMTVLHGDSHRVAGVEVLGDGDPQRSELFGGTYLRDDVTEEQVGRRLRRTAEQHRPAMVLVHEAYAAAAFLGVDDMRGFLDARGSATRRFDDGVPDVPAGAVFYGHWHRSVEPRVVWNSDGTWTLVMELDTSGGAVASPTIGHFSTPWSAPQQEASFPVVFLDKETGLVTGYQVYSFATDGTVTVRPRVEVGDQAAGR
jgi:hypothetical protein